MAGFLEFHALTCTPCGYAGSLVWLMELDYGLAYWMHICLPVDFTPSTIFFTSSHNISLKKFDTSLKVRREEERLEKKKPCYTCIALSPLLHVMWVTEA